MIKIISGWSNKCKSGLLKDFKPNKDDTVIVHFLTIPKLDVKRTILSCHEKNLYQVGKIEPFWDKVVFINEKHRKYHSGYKGDFVCIPNLKESFIKKGEIDEDSDLYYTAGVVGSIDKNKQTHVSINRALRDGFEKVYIFGNVTDVPYYDKFVKPLIGENVIEYGFIGDKQKMYDMVSEIYLSSESEVASLVKDECESTGTVFNGNYATENDSKSLTNEEIMEEWIKVLEL